MHRAIAHDFASWRSTARNFLLAQVPPEQLAWHDKGSDQVDLFAAHSEANAVPVGTITIPRDFLTLAEIIAAHRDPGRWALLYTALWRIVYHERQLLRLSTDPLIQRLNRMRQAVKRDAHKAKAFVRFRETTDEDGQLHYIAWHCPDHFVLPLVAPFFARRFAIMRWTILSPDASVHWDGRNLHFAEGVTADAAPSEDKLEDLWRDYYRATFNPARIKLKMMRSEMPVRYWKNLPETRIIPDMLKEADQRVEAMIAHREGLESSAADYIPDYQNDAPDMALAKLCGALPSCRGCTLYAAARQAVSGTGPANATIMLVGEQPGSEENQTGLPFVGPAGGVLDQALSEVGLSRHTLFITNAVKHYKFRTRPSADGGFIDTHESPNTAEINACKPWLAAELAIIQPRIVVALGRTAIQSLVGHGTRLKDVMGRWITMDDGTLLRATYHPAAILRAKESRDSYYQQLVHDLRAVMDVHVR